MLGLSPGNWKRSKNGTLFEVGEAGLGNFDGAEKQLGNNKGRLWGQGWARAMGVRIGLGL